MAIDSVRRMRPESVEISEQMEESTSLEVNKGYHGN